MEGVHFPVTTARPALFLAAFLWIIFSGCGRGGEKQPPPPHPPAPVPQATPALPSPAESTPARTAEPRINASLVLAPDNPDAESGVRARLAGIPPEVAVQWKKVSWFINGTGFPGERERLPAGMIRRGDRVQAIAEIEAGGKTEILTSHEITVRNCLPEVLSAALSNMEPKTGQEVRALASGKDADGDPVSFRYRWFLNDKEVEGQSMNALSLEKVPKGTWVHAEVQAFDGISPGSKRFTPKVLVINSPPTVEQVAITRGTGGYFTANLRVRDADGDPVTILAKSLPEGIDLSETALSWRESALPPGKDAPVVLLLSDGDGGDVEYSFRLIASQK